mmetsp:Transcript_83474/g.232877  ORF Transcript_83474/g.232877 Transcript_83474/m.232877 type:complete len:388 (+) Transcript_83474:88-1251(+)
MKPVELAESVMDVPSPLRTGRRRLATIPDVPTADVETSRCEDGRSVNSRDEPRQPLRSHSSRPSSMLGLVGCVSEVWSAATDRRLWSSRRRVASSPPHSPNCSSRCRSPTRARPSAEPTPKAQPRRDAGENQVVATSPSPPTLGKKLPGSPRLQQPSSATRPGQGPSADRPNTDTAAKAARFAMLADGAPQRSRRRRSPPSASDELGVRCCAECARATSRGAIDVVDGFWYCNPCWEWMEVALEHVAKFFGDSNSAISSEIESLHLRIQGRMTLQHRRNAVKLSEAIRHAIKCIQQSQAGSGEASAAACNDAPAPPVEAKASSPPVGGTTEDFLETMRDRTRKRVEWRWRHAGYKLPEEARAPGSAPGMRACAQEASTSSRPVAQRR